MFQICIYGLPSAGWSRAVIEILYWQAMKWAWRRLSSPTSHLSSGCRWHPPVYAGVSRSCKDWYMNLKTKWLWVHFWLPNPPCVHRPRQEKLEQMSHDGIHHLTLPAVHTVAFSAHRLMRPCRPILPVFVFFFTFDYITLWPITVDHNMFRNWLFTSLILWRPGTRMGSW